MSDPCAIGRRGTHAGRFVGREREVAELRALLRDERVITLSGAGGVGKTRLASRVAELERARGAGEVWRVELERVADPSLIMRELARSLGVRSPTLDRSVAGTRRGFGGPAGGVLAHLRAARGLVVLDGCEHLRDGCAELVRELAGSCPGVRILVTGRRPLGIAGELVRRVPPLALPCHGRPDAEAVMLFVDRALAAGGRVVNGGMGDVERLCRMLDGMPLALELAAARTRSLTPAQILHRIGRRHGLPAEGSARTVPAVVEWSHELLRPKERVLLRRLPVFAGPFDLELAGRVCADGGIVRRGELPGLLGGLVRDALVVRQADGGHRLHAVVREYAAERSREAAEEAWLRDRHLRAIRERRHESAPPTRQGGRS
ncbi:ATP-binding protein [Nonomuraea sp. LPB2021202275-12-8]|uniref:ATP-binding protein n=1 Tax=Nonomuraea sp. LPB2021202275-12-8 TaxID=3120159 RepID=UPI00300CA58C